jgi:hypothetical protein
VFEHELDRPMAQATVAVIEEQFGFWWERAAHPRKHSTPTQFRFAHPQRVGMETAAGQSFRMILSYLQPELTGENST